MKFGEIWKHYDISQEKIEYLVENDLDYDIIECCTDDKGKEVQIINIQSHPVDDIVYYIPLSLKKFCKDSGVDESEFYDSLYRGIFVEHFFKLRDSEDEI